MKFARTCILSVFCVGAAFCQTPVIVAGGVLNAASFDKTAGANLAPGQLVSIFGSDLASGLQSNDTVPLSTSLSDSVSVTFNGIQAGLDFVSPGQINAQLPWNVLPGGAGTGTATVVVTRNGTASAQAVINIGATAPGIFSVSFGTGYAIAINSADGQLAAPAGGIPGLLTHPAKAGDVLIVYTTGLGPVDIPITNGGIPPTGPPFANTVARPTVLIGGVPAQVAFSGLTPQFPGVNQLNVVVPAGVTAGASIPLQIQVSGGALSRADVVIAVQ
jgi:uncharacterized protein (TIGR03437 family)